MFYILDPQTLTPYRFCLACPRSLWLGLADVFVCFCFVFLMLIVGEGGRLQSRIQAMQMRCYLKILRISYYQGGSLCQDPAGNRTTRRPNHRKETQTEVVLTCLPFIRSGPALYLQSSHLLCALVFVCVSNFVNHIYFFLCRKAF